MSKKNVYGLICILVIYLVLNIYVSFIQKKILMIGDWPHDIFNQFYGSLGIAFAWSPSISFVEFDKTVNNNNFDIVIIDIVPSNVNSSQKNIDIIKKLSKHSKIYWITNDIDGAQLIKREYNLDLYIMTRDIENIDTIIN